MKKSILLSIGLLLVSGISSLAQTNKGLSQNKDKNATTIDTSIKDQDTSSRNIRIKQLSFNTINQIDLHPIIVIDGKVSDHGLSGIEPNDIQSMSVFKGEKAAKLYGDKNGAGVIVITTKKKANESKAEKEPNKK
jgi:hypothetical protein